MAGLLKGILGPATPDPMGAMLGQYYNPEVERGKRLSGLLSGMGAAILNPSQDPAHRGGSGIGEIGRAFAKGSAQAGESGSGYLHEAYKRKIAADEMRRKQYTEDEQLKEDAAMADWVAQLPPELQKDAQANPRAYYEEYIKHKYSGSDPEEYFKGDIVQSRDEKGEPLFNPDGSPQYESVQTSKTGGEPKRQKISGTPLGDPGVKAKAAGMKITAEENNKNLIALPKNITQSTNIIETIDDVMARPELQKYVGMGSLWKDIPETEAQAVKAEMSQLAGQYRLQAIALWRGMGQFTEAEGQASVDAASAAQQAQSPKEFAYYMAKARWHATYAQRLAERQLQDGDTTKYIAPAELMSDYPKPKRDDFGPDAKKKKDEGGNPELEEALDIYPD